MNNKPRFFRYLIILISAAIFGFGIIQLIPYGRDHSNPPVIQEPNWDSSTTRDLAKRACFDCHSNETVWPWYSNIAPVSWLVQHDTEEGRSKLNFSEWQSAGSRGRETGEIFEVVQEGSMPPLQYLPTHPEARLSAQEKQQLASGLQNTLK
jgi:hypothetical protein